MPPHLHFDSSPHLLEHLPGQQASQQAFALAQVSLQRGAQSHLTPHYHFLRSYAVAPYVSVLFPFFLLVWLLPLACVGIPPSFYRISLYFSALWSTFPRSPSP